MFEPADLIRGSSLLCPAAIPLAPVLGVLSSHSRAGVSSCPARARRRDREQAPPARGDQLELIGDTDDAPAPRKRWAWLLAHVFAADVETCPRCSGPMRWAEVANTRAQITRLLAEHGLGPRAPPATRVGVSVPEQLMLGFGKE
ncbi:MAG: hypothetical protein HS104_16850 [Polyangiaceae bacterium]|nr:hypothetical protein [Polyangiaceae bacterium]